MNGQSACDEVAFFDEDCNEEPCCCNCRGCCPMKSSRPVNECESNEAYVGCDCCKPCTSGSDFDFHPQCTCLKMSYPGLECTCSDHGDDSIKTYESKPARGCDYDDNSYFDPHCTCEKICSSELKCICLDHGDDRIKILKPRPICCAKQACCEDDGCIDCGFSGKCKCNKGTLRPLIPNINVYRIPDENHPLAFIEPCNDKKCGCKENGQRNSLQCSPEKIQASNCLQMSCPPCCNPCPEREVCPEIPSLGQPLTCSGGPNTDAYLSIIQSLCRPKQCCQNDGGGCNVQNECGKACCPQKDTKCPQPAIVPYGLCKEVVTKNNIVEQKEVCLLDQKPRISTCPTSCPRVPQFQCPQKEYEGNLSERISKCGCPCKEVAKQDTSKNSSKKEDSRQTEKSMKIPKSGKNQKLKGKGKGGPKQKSAKKAKNKPKTGLSKERNTNKKGKHQKNKLNNNA